MVVVMRTGDSSSVAGKENKPELIFSAQPTTFLAFLSPTHSLRSPEFASPMSTFMPKQAMPGCH